MYRVLIWRNVNDYITMICSAETVKVHIADAREDSNETWNKLQTRGKVACHIKKDHSLHKLTITRIDE